MLMLYLDEKYVLIWGAGWGRTFFGYLYQKQQMSLKMTPVWLMFVCIPLVR